MAGHLELLTHSQVSLARGRNLDTITGSQTINGFLPLKSDLWLTSCGLYLIELVNQFTPEHVENPALFRLLVDTMHNLCRDVDRELVLRHFELHLLHAVGYRPQLQQCVACRRTLEPVTNYFSPTAGGVLCPDCRQAQPFNYAMSVNALKVLRLLQSTDYGAVVGLRIDAQLSREMESIMRNYLKHLLERDLRSADWMDRLRDQMAQAPPQEK